MSDLIHIPMSECKHGYLYLIEARHAYLGIFDTTHSPTNPGFITRRLKFYDIFLWTENHWDTGAPYGTAKPYEILEKVPDSLEKFETKDDNSILRYLEDAENRYAQKIKDLMPRIYSWYKNE